MMESEHLVSEPAADARRQRELALDLAETLEPKQLQALYQIVVKATKLQ